MYYTINTLVVANDQRLILACDQDWHGAAHDAREHDKFYESVEKYWYLKT
jgi:hypothetical protein